MELEKTGKQGRQILELYAHTPDPRDAFTDSRYAITVTFRLTLSKEQWRTANINNVYKLLPPLPNCKMNNVKLVVETLLYEKRKWLVFTFLCKSEYTGNRIYEALEKAFD